MTQYEPIVIWRNVDPGYTQSRRTKVEGKTFFYHPTSRELWFSNIAKISGSIISEMQATRHVIQYLKDNLK